jgi:hypothetical protein
MPPHLVTGRDIQHCDLIGYSLNHGFNRRNLTPDLFEAPPGFLDFLVGNALGPCPCLHSRLAILGYGLPYHPAGNGVRGN